MNERTITVGRRPDPDDAFMFYGLASGNGSSPASASRISLRTSSR